MWGQLTNHDAAKHHIQNPHSNLTSYITNVILQAQLLDQLSKQGNHKKNMISKTDNQVPILDHKYREPLTEA